MRMNIRRMLAGITLCAMFVTNSLTGLNQNASAAEPGVVETVGDINGDNEINAKDVTMLRRYLAQGWGVTVNEEDADINGDNEVNAKDVTMLRRYLAKGWGVELPEKANKSFLSNVSDWWVEDEVYHLVISTYGEQGELIREKEILIDFDTVSVTNEEMRNLYRTSYYTTDYSYDAEGRISNKIRKTFADYTYNQWSIEYRPYLSKCVDTISEIYTYGENNEILNIRKIHNDDIEITEKYEYDDSGRLIEKTVDYYDKAGYEYSDIYDYFYADESNVFEDILYWDGSAVFTNKTYNKDGKIEKEIVDRYNGIEEETYIYNYFYDSLGNLIRKEEKWEGYGDSTVLTYQYHNGKKVSEGYDEGYYYSVDYDNDCLYQKYREYDNYVYLDEDGTIIRTISKNDSFEYIDDISYSYINNNLSAVTSIHTWNNLESGDTDIYDKTIAEYKYEDGRLSEEYLEYHRSANYVYDTAGKIIKINLNGEDGYVAYMYDDAGRVIEEKTIYGSKVDTIKTFVYGPDGYLSEYGEEAYTYDYTNTVTKVGRSGLDVIKYEFKKKTSENGIVTESETEYSNMGRPMHFYSKSTSSDGVLVGESESIYRDPGVMEKYTSWSLDGIRSTREIIEYDMQGRAISSVKEIKDSDGSYEHYEEYQYAPYTDDYGNEFFNKTYECKRTNSISGSDIYYTSDEVTREYFNDYCLKQESSIHKEENSTILGSGERHVYFKDYVEVIKEYDLDGKQLSHYEKKDGNLYGYSSGTIKWYYEYNSNNILSKMIYTEIYSEEEHIKNIYYCDENGEPYRMERKLEDGSRFYVRDASGSWVEE